MSVNVYKPHVLVLPEDDANRQIAIGFWLCASVKYANIQVLLPSGGWVKVLESFINSHLKDLQKYACRHLVLLIDFDDKFEERSAYFLQHIPGDVRDRVFLLGTSSEPEPLRKSCGKSLEAIGKQLAVECYGGETNLWAHEFLAHNAPECQRLNAKVKSILF